METAGAERGYLLLPKPEERDVLWTAAQGFGEEVQIHVSDHFEDSQDLSEGVSFHFYLHPKTKKHM